MIHCRSRREIERMREAGAVVAEALEMCKRLAEPGVSTEELDRKVETLIQKRNGKALFKGYHGYPKAICTSINEEVVHGIPGSRKLKSGDIISVDIGVGIDGYCSDAAATFGVGRISAEARDLIQVCETSLERAIQTLRPNMRLSQISRAVQGYVESQGCSVVRKYTGHGIGRQMHEDPQVPNFVARSMADPMLPEGVVVAIEPMVNAGGHEVEVLKNGWTVVTKDRSLSAHSEHTVAIQASGPEILTLKSA